MHLSLPICYPKKSWNGPSIMVLPIYQKWTVVRNLTTFATNFAKLKTCEMDISNLYELDAQIFYNIKNIHFWYLQNKVFYSMKNLEVELSEKTQTEKCGCCPRDMATILCLTLRTTVTSARIPEEDACHRTHNLCVFLRVQKGTPGWRIKDASCSRDVTKYRDMY